MTSEMANLIYTMNKQTNTNIFLSEFTLFIDAFKVQKLDFRKLFDINANSQVNCSLKSKGGIQEGSMKLSEHWKRSKLHKNKQNEF